MTNTPEDRPDQSHPASSEPGAPTGSAWSDPTTGQGSGQNPPEQPGYSEQHAPGPGHAPPGWEHAGQQPQAPRPWGYLPPGAGYPAPGYPTGYPAQVPDHPRATTSLVLGILSVAACQVLGPLAWWMGKKTLDEIDASGGRYGGRGAAQAGYVMGVVGTVLLALALVIVVLYVLFVVALIGGVMTAPAG